MSASRAPFLVLVILDGWGHSPRVEGNAIAACRSDVMRTLAARYPSTLLHASGEAVGLPPGIMGNSEVGHLAIGAGRVVEQDLTLLSRAVTDGSLRRNSVLAGACAAAARGGSTLHLLGLVSDGGVHSHVDHLRALVSMAIDQGVGRLRVHAFTDGRDTPPRSARGYIGALENWLGETGGRARLATVSGRYFAMDRDRNWDRTERAWRALVRAEGPQSTSALAAVEDADRRGETDEFILPTVIQNVPGGRVVDGDIVIFFNFRADRARQLTRALALDTFEGFERGERPRPGRFVCLTQYDKTFGLPVAFTPDRPEMVLGRLFSERGDRQVRVAETEKYAHVTYFLNGGVERIFPGEDRIMVPSPKVATYDLQPEMSAHETTTRAVERLARRDTEVLVMNLANADMVGHTGRFDATVKACEVVDGCVGRLQEAARATGALCVVTADHGNAEQMIDPRTGEPHTAHTTNPVPLILVREDLIGTPLAAGGGLADVLPTILRVLDLPQPVEMSGRALL